MNSIAPPHLAGNAQTTDELSDIIMQELMPTITELVRRAVDGTVAPLFVDLGNQRVLIGAIAVSAAPSGKLEVTGDIKVLGGGNGIMLPCRNGINWGRVILENPDANGNIVISVDKVI